MGVAAPADAGSILLVDDDEAVSRVYAKALLREGFNVFSTSNALQAREVFQRETIDLVLSDINMPGMSGIQLLELLRRQDLDVPVILMTGAPGIESATEAVTLGAMRYLTKPIDLCELERIAHKAVGLHRLARIKRQALAQLGLGERQLGDLAGLNAGFGRCLSTLWMAYQPIVLWSKHRVFAYEALLRSPEPTLPCPKSVLDAADRLDRVHDLGRKIRGLVAQDIASFPEPAQIFVNLHPHDLMDDQLVLGDCPLTEHSRRVVLEITERATLEGMTDIRARVAKLRGLGYRIALDDLGAGYAGLTSFAHLEPDIVKIDRSLVENIGSDRTKQKLLGSLAQLCGQLDMQVICEGIETREERDMLLTLDCDLLQGYLFARPERIPISAINW
jgi:EAL domain-containing protein (putative c-di-GMP-specific phosphodiesterase class I)/ActR/RegA family two-component response regulator